MNPFTKSVSSDNVLLLRFEDIGPGWEQWILLSSDRHLDSKDSDHRKQKRHLDLAKQRDALIVDIGDLFDAMQGRNDKRSAKAIRPALVGPDYFDRLVDYAADFMGPYAKNLLLLGTGNHETAVLKHNEINLTWQLARRLNAEHGGDIHMGRYAGYVRMTFRLASEQRGYAKPMMLYYHHGSGGSAPVTLGVIKTARRAVYLPDADVVLTGHTHRDWLVPRYRERVTAQGRVYIDKQMHVSLPSYKSPARDAGWAAEKGFAPVGTGAIWMHLTYANKAVRADYLWAE